MFDSHRDMLLVEDVAETVEGLELDLRARGGNVFLVADARHARESIRQDEWALILYDLRIPEFIGDEPRLEVGVDLILSNIRGDLGQLNRDKTFGIITMQTTVPEVDKFVNLPSFLGFFSKNEDPRRLFAALRERGLLKDYDFEEDAGADVRRRVKFFVKGVDPAQELVYASVPAWGDQLCAIRLADFRPHLRRRLVSGPFPVFVYGTANVGAQTVQGLLPGDFEEIAEDVPPLRLDTDAND